MFSDINDALHKAKALEPAVFSECRGVIATIPTITNFAKYSPDGSLVVVHSAQDSCISVWLARNGDLVAEFPTKGTNSAYFSADVSTNNKCLVYIDDDGCHTKKLPIDGNGDIIDDSSASQTVVDVNK